MQARRRFTSSMRLLTSAVAVLVTCLLAACGRDRVGSGGAAQLEGRAFLSQSVSGRVLVAGTQIRLAFLGGELTAHAGCNSLGSRYEVAADRLVVRGGLATTEMGCDAQRHAQDEWLAGFLQSGPRVDLQGDTLTLTTAETTVRLLDRAVADPDRPLIGTRWRIDTVLQGQAASSVPQEAPVILEFHADGALTATSAGCTSARLEFEVDGQALRFGEFVIDAIGCPPPWEATVELLRTGEARHAITAARLMITSGDIGVAAVAD